MSSATGVLAYAGEVFSGKRKYLMELPMIPGPGAIGRVRAIGPDATHLAAGDWVYCDPTVRSRDDALAPDITLQGWTPRNEGGLRLQQHFHDGSFAEQMRVPTENVKPLGAIDAGGRAPMVRARHAAGALRRPAGREPAGGRDRAGQRRHRQFRQRRGRGRAGDGRGLRRCDRPQRESARGSVAALRLARADRQAQRRRGRGSRADETGRARPDRLRVRYPAALGQRDRGAGRR